MVWASSASIEGRFDEAAIAHRESIGLLEGIYGKEHPLLVAPLANLGESYLKMGKLDSASLAYQRAMDICDKSAANQDLLCGVNMTGYAELLRKLGRKREAKAIEARSRQVDAESRRRNGIGMTVDASALRAR